MIVPIIKSTIVVNLLLHNIYINYDTVDSLSIALLGTGPSSELKCPDYPIIRGKGEFYEEKEDSS